MGIEITSQMVTIIVSVLGVFATCLTVIIGKIYEKKMYLKKIKEEQYIDFLTALARGHSNNTRTGKDEIKIDLSIKI